MSRDLSAVLQMLQAARLIQDFVTGVDRDTFEHDVMRQFAVIRAIEIIGEATRRLSDAFRLEHAQIPWKDMAGMRSKLIHDYDTVDLVQVWEVIQTDIPALIAQIGPLVPPDEPDRTE